MKLYSKNAPILLIAGLFVGIFGIVFVKFSLMFFGLVGVIGAFKILFTPLLILNEDNFVYNNMRFFGKEDVYEHTEDIKVEFDKQFIKVASGEKNFLIFPEKIFGKKKGLECRKYFEDLAK